MGELSRASKSLDLSPWFNAVRFNGSYVHNGIVKCKDSSTSLLYKYEEERDLDDLDAAHQQAVCGSSFQCASLVSRTILSH